MQNAKPVNLVKDDLIEISGRLYLVNKVTLESPYVDEDFTCLTVELVRAVSTFTHKDVY